MSKAAKKKRTVKKNVFLNEYVLLTLNLNINKMEQDDNGSSQLIKPLQLKGWLIKEDREFLYLGDDQETISFYIKKENIAYVECIAIVDELDEKLDEYKEGISN